MNVAARFLKDEDVEGIRLLQDLPTVKKLKIKLGNLNHGPHNSFPVNKPVPLNKRHFLPAEINEPYVVAPKPRSWYPLFALCGSNGQNVHGELDTAYLRIGSRSCCTKDSKGHGLGRHRSKEDCA